MQVWKEKLADAQAQLEQVIKTKKSEIQVALWEREVVVRQQVSQEFNQQIVELEERYSSVQQHTHTHTCTFCKLITNSNLYFVGMCTLLHAHVV